MMDSGVNGTCCSQLQSLALACPPPPGGKYAPSLHQLRMGSGAFPPLCTVCSYSTPPRVAPLHIAPAHDVLWCQWRVLRDLE